MIFAVIITAVLVIFIGIIKIYNNTVRKNNLVLEAWHDVDVQLKRRFDLIPNLVEVVKKYAEYEAETLKDIIKHRNEWLTPKNAAEADTQYSGALKHLFAVAENYPQLKANENFKDLQESLQKVEDNIQNSRRYYNATVRDYNTYISMYPAKILATFLHLQNKDFFQIENASEKEMTKVGL